MLKRDQIVDFFSREIKFEGVERELKVEKVPNKIISVIGPRRVGKTWYFYYLFNHLDRPMYVNFEDISFKNINAYDFFEIIKIFSEIKYEPKTILIDEVQTIKDWESLVRSLQERDFEIYITGSSSKLLSREIATQLRGRSISYLLLPFSFREFLRAKKFGIEMQTFEKMGSLLKMLREYLEFGGFPEVVLQEAKERILKEYFEEIFYKDFVERHSIKSLEFGRFLFEFIFQNFSKEISLRKIKLLFPRTTSYSTLYSYIEKLEDTLVVFFLKRFSFKARLRASWPRKVYVCDLGISSLLKFSEDIGKRMENTVFLELLRKTNENPLMEIFYFRANDKEVDFVIKEGLNVKQLIQVSYASARDEIDERETKALVKASELLRCKDLMMITWDYEDRIKEKNREIKCVPLWKWLLNV